MNPFVNLFHMFPQGDIAKKYHDLLDEKKISGSHLMQLATPFYKRKKREKIHHLSKAQNRRRRRK